MSCQDVPEKIKDGNVDFANRCSLMTLAPNKLGLLKKINSVIFPVPYSPQYYKDVMSKSVANYCKLAYFDDIPVGAVTCKVEKDKKGKNVLYIQTLGVLAVYRGCGVGQRMLDAVLKPTPSFVIPKEKVEAPLKIARVYLHVHTCNEDAKRFYEKNGFVQTGIEETYYPKLEVKSAWVLTKEIVD